MSATAGDPSFGVFAPPPLEADVEPPPSLEVELPDLDALRVMTAGELEDLLLDLLAERAGVSLAELLRGPTYEGSLRTRSILMVAVLNQIAEHLGVDLLKPQDLDDPLPWRTVGGTAGMLKTVLARMEVPTK